MADDARMSENDTHSKRQSDVEPLGAEKKAKETSLIRKVKHNTRSQSRKILPLSTANALTDAAPTSPTPVSVGDKQDTASDIEAELAALTENNATNTNSTPAPPAATTQAPAAANMPAPAAAAQPPAAAAQISADGIRPDVTLGRVRVTFSDPIPKNHQRAVAKKLMIELGRELNTVFPYNLIDLKNDQKTFDLFTPNPATLSNAARVRVLAISSAAADEIPKGEFSGRVVSASAESIKPDDMSVPDEVRDFVNSLLIVNANEDITELAIRDAIRDFTSTKAFTTRCPHFDVDTVRIFRGASRNTGTGWFGVGVDDQIAHNLLDGALLRIIPEPHLQIEEPLVPAARHLSGDDIVHGAIFQVPPGRTVAQIKAEFEGKIPGLQIKYIRRIYDKETGLPRRIVQWVATNADKTTRDQLAEAQKNKRFLSSGMSIRVRAHAAAQNE